METRIVRIYGEGSGIIVETIGIVSVILVAIGLMVGSAYWFPTETSSSDTPAEKTWLELAAEPTFANPNTPAEPPSGSDSLLSKLKELDAKSASTRLRKLPETSEASEVTNPTTLDVKLAEVETKTKPAPAEPVVLAGDWVGSWQNDTNESGGDTLTLQQNEQDFIAGVWSGDIQIRGERIGPNVIFFEGMSQQRQYQCAGFLEGDQLRLDYRAHRLPQGGRYYGSSEFAKSGPDGKPTSDIQSKSPTERRKFAGSWTGTYENSKSQTGNQTLTLVENDDALEGDMSGDRAAGLRLGSNSFHLVSIADNKLYDVVGRFEQDRLMLYYTATSKSDRYFGKATLSPQQ